MDETFESLKFIDLTEEDLDSLTEIIPEDMGWWFNRTGIPHSEESKQLMSERHTGVALSDSHKKSISKALAGKSRPPFSDEWKQKISNSKKGNKCRLGIPQSEEVKQKISNANKGRTAWNKGKTGMKYNKLKD